jgi:hypothetical protein
LCRGRQRTEEEEGGKYQFFHIDAFFYAPWGNGFSKQKGQLTVLTRADAEGQTRATALWIWRSMP